MNIGKIMQFATEGLKAVKSMPLSGKVAVGALFGVSGLTGVLIGDSFEKGAEVNEGVNQEVNQGVKEEVKKEAKLVTNPQEQPDSVKAKEPEKPAFKYVPPKIGERDIVKADTVYRLGTDKIECISYKKENGKLVHVTNFDENGDLQSFDNYFTDSQVADNLDFVVLSYDKDGKPTVHDEYRKDGSRYYERNLDGGSVSFTYDTKGRQTSWEDTKSGLSLDISYNSDGSRVVNHYKYGTIQSQNTEDKNEKLLKRKEYNSDGVLKHTIMPKYNKEGDIVRNDTIPNK